MSIVDLERAFNLIGNFEEEERFFGGKNPENLIEKAEQDLDLQFPKTYRKFLKEYGYGGINSLDIDGITEYKFDGSDYGGVVWNTLNYRNDFSYPKYLIPIYNVGEGTIYCLDTSQMNEEGECPVVAWPLGGYEETPVLEVVAEDFGKFFLDMVQRQIEYKNALAK